MKYNFYVSRWDHGEQISYFDLNRFHEVKVIIRDVRIIASLPHIDKAAL